MFEKLPKKEQESAINPWKKISSGVLGATAAAVISITPSTESFAQNTKGESETDIYREKDIVYQKEQIQAYATHNLFIYSSITERVRKHLEFLKENSKREYLKFENELKQGKEYSIRSDAHPSFEITHILVGLEGRVLGSMVQKEEGDAMKSFVDNDGDGMIDRIIIDKNKISDQREHIEFAHRLVSLDLNNIAEKFTDTRKQVYIPRDVIVVDIALTDEIAQITSVDYGQQDRPVGTREKGDKTLEQILKQSQYLYQGLIHAEHHLEKLDKKNKTPGALVLNN